MVELASLIFALRSDVKYFNNYYLHISRMNLSKYIMLTNFSNNKECSFKIKKKKKNLGKKQIFYFISSQFL